MGQTLTDLNYHIVFSTKNRDPMLHAGIRPRVHDYIGGIIREVGGTAHRIGGMADHIHIACGVPPTLSVSAALRTVKANSSRWIRLLSPKLKSFAWQAGYSAFTVSKSQLGTVIRYVENQEEHHRRLSFKDELRGIFAKHGVDYDENYLWD